MSDERLKRHVARVQKQSHAWKLKYKSLKGTFDIQSRELAAARTSLNEALGLLRESCMNGPSIEWAERRDALLRKVGM